MADTMTFLLSRNKVKTKQIFIKTIILLESKHNFAFLFRLCERRFGNCPGNGVVIPFCATNFEEKVFRVRLTSL